MWEKFAAGLKQANWATKAGIADFVEEIFWWYTKKCEHKSYFK